MHKPNQSIQTSLGVNIENTKDNLWKIDLTQLRLFKGLSVIAQLLGNETLESLSNNSTDVFVQRKVIEEIAPELHLLGIENITIFSRQPVLTNINQTSDAFQNCLRTVLGTLQRPKWGSVLFPEAFAELINNKKNNPTKIKNEPKALVFPFYLTEENPFHFYFLVERNIEAKLLTITIENHEDTRLNLDSIPHQVVSDLHQRYYLQGLTRISETVYQGILQECENSNFEYTDNDRRHPHFFSQLAKIGLKGCDNLSIRWPSDHTDQIIKIQRRLFIDKLKKVFLILEDLDTITLLNNQSLLQVIVGEFRVYIDLSRKGKCLNVSLFEKRKSLDLNHYLNRMPILEKLSKQTPNVFHNTRILLIHHITGEILATIKALENMGMDFLHVLFVKYAGIVPADYLEVLLTLDSDRFHFTGLQKVDVEEQLEGYHMLSNQYSDIKNYSLLKDHLVDSRLAYFDAMNFSAIHLFLTEAILAYNNNQKLMLIEDGGYLAPDINRMCLENKTIGEIFTTYKVEITIPKDAKKKIDPKESFAKWLKTFLVCSIEHTRNGFNRLEDVEKDFKKLYFPAGSIAISNIKRNLESEEVSISILHAIESILHGQGFVMSTRKALILGSRGAIGLNLMEDLSDRLGHKQVLGVDISINKNKDLKYHEVADFTQLSNEEISEIDLIIGVIGESILDPKDLERLIINSKKSKLYFASGSTKTAEFTHLTKYIHDLQKNKNPNIANIPISLDFDNIRDPQTRGIVGDRVQINFSNATQKDNPYNFLCGTSKELMLLGGLTPINFLFYGVPTETMDAILSQLIEVSAGMHQYIEEGFVYENRLLAIDRDIEPNGTLLKT